MVTGLLKIVFHRHIKKIVWNHVGYNNFISYGNRSGISCSSDNILCTECCRKVFQILYNVFMLSSYCKKTYRMGYLCIPVCIYISSFSRDSQGYRLPFLHKDRFSIHKHSVFIHIKKTRRENVSQMIWKIPGIKMCKFKILVFHSTARNDHPTTRQ